MGAPRHGKNGLIYVGGTELSAANSWSIDVAADLVETGVLGDTWKGQLKGLVGWSGSINAYDYEDEKILFTAATGATAVALLIYPKRSELTDYYSGNAMFGGMTGDGSTSSAVNRNGSFTGDGALSMTGFS